MSIAMPQQQGSTQLQPMQMLSMQPGAHNMSPGHPIQQMPQMHAAQPGQSMQPMSSLTMHTMPTMHPGGGGISPMGAMGHMQTADYSSFAFRKRHERIDWRKLCTFFLNFLSLCLKSYLVFINFSN